VQVFRLSRQLKNGAGAGFRIQACVRRDTPSLHAPRRDSLALGFHESTGPGRFKHQYLRRAASFSFDQRTTRRTASLLIARKKEGNWAAGRKSDGCQTAQDFDRNHTGRLHVEDAGAEKPISINAYRA
jgi:hypothetical protein